MHVSRTRLLLTSAAGVVAVSFASILIRFAQAEQMPPLAIATWRLLFASLVVLPYAWTARRQEARGLSRRDLKLLLAAGAFLGLHFASWIASLAYTSVASSAVLVSMGPVFVALGSWLLLGERPGKLLAMGIALAAAGSILISWGDFGRGQAPLWGDLLALAGAALVAGYFMIGRQVRARLSLVIYVALVYGGGMLTLLAITLVSAQPLLGFSPASYGWVLLLALGPQVVGHSSLNWALRYLSAEFVAIVTLAEPIGAGLLAFLLLDEAIGWPTFLGGALVLTGILLASRAELAKPAK